MVCSKLIETKESKIILFKKTIDKVMDFSEGKIWMFWKAFSNILLKLMPESENIYFQYYASHLILCLLASCSKGPMDLIWHDSLWCSQTSLQMVSKYSLKHGHFPWCLCYYKRKECVSIQIYMYMFITIFWLSQEF